MFNRIQIGLTAGLAASLLMTVPIVAQQYPPPQQADPQSQQQPQYPPQQQPQYPAQQQPQYPPQQQGQYPPPQGQYPPQQAPANFSPDQLNNLVSRIALYPDPLLAQIFAASTFPDQIPAAAQWADQHHYLTGAALAQAIQGDQLTFDPSVQALLPFPQVLAMMAGDLNWTSSLGNAFLSQGPMLEDAVQNMRHQAYNYGYLRSNQQIAVTAGPYITIAPTNPGYIVVPYYDPSVVFYRPWRPGFAGISFGYGIGIGTYFNPWGWGGAYFGWGNHSVFINNAVWGRNWNNRLNYVHPYAGIERRGFVGGREPVRGGFAPGRVGVEQHALEGRSQAERHAAQTGRALPREGHGHEDHRH